MRCLVPLLLLVVVALGAGFAWEQRYRLTAPPADVDRRQGAVWMAHRWFGEGVGEEEIRAAGAQLAQLGIRDLYFHTGPLDAKGQIPAYDAARWRRTQALFREAIPGLRSFAWVGGLTVQGYGVAPDTVDDVDEHVRAAVIRTSKELLDSGLFDGLHYSLEPVANRDQSFVTLLEETRAELGSSRVLSVAAPCNWDSEYFKLVGRNCDQIALTGYDQGLPTRGQYEEFLERVVPVACDALKGSKCRLVVGVSSSEEASGQHNPAVENLESGLIGLRRGLVRTSDRKPFQGAGVYAHWTTQPSEWETYRALWQPPGK